MHYHPADFLTSFFIFVLFYLLISLYFSEAVPVSPFSPGGPGIPSRPWLPLIPIGPGGPGNPGGPETNRNPNHTIERHGHLFPSMAYREHRGRREKVLRGTEFSEPLFADLHKIKKSMPKSILS